MHPFLSLSRFPLWSRRYIPFWENVNGVDERGYEEFASGASTFPLRLI